MDKDLKEFLQFIGTLIILFLMYLTIGIIVSGICFNKYGYSNYSTPSHARTARCFVWPMSLTYYIVDIGTESSANYFKQKAEEIK
jgi:hypothetical protein